MPPKSDHELDFERRLTRIEVIVYVNIALTCLWGGRDILLKLLTGG